MKVLRVTPSFPNRAERARQQRGLAIICFWRTSDLSPWPFSFQRARAASIFERIRNALPRGRGSAQEWVSCIFCFSLRASAIVCVLLWTGGLRLALQEWTVHWLGFSAVALIVNQ